MCAVLKTQNDFFHVKTQTNIPTTNTTMNSEKENIVDSSIATKDHTSKREKPSSRAEVCPKLFLGF
jgi:hypothetical protein